MNNILDSAGIRDYEDIINNIKNWIESFRTG